MANQPASTALANPEDLYHAAYENLAGAFRKAKDVTSRLRWAEEKGMHLVTPATTCAQLPEGCSVAISVVHLDVATDTHDVGFGKRSILKHALMKLAAAAGIRMDPARSGRIDDGSDPYYCHWRAIGAWQHLDGSVLPIVGDREVDLREGSAQTEKIFATAKDKSKADNTLREMRSFIMGHAQSKAELRAIRKALGIRTYTADELEHPFVIIKLMFDGYSDDPAIKAANAAAIRNVMLGGAQALFGPPPQQQGPAALPMPSMPSLPMPSHAPAMLSQGHAPPPVSATRDDDDDVIDVAAQPPSSPATPSPQASTRKPRSAPKPNSAPVARFGKDIKGKALTELTDKDLTWYRDAIQKGADDPERAQYRENSLAHLAEIDAEIARRKGGGAKSETHDPDFADDRGDDPDRY